MQFMKCKWGEKQCWTSMGNPSCDVCEKCGSTLGYCPDSHPAPTPHDVHASIEKGRVVAHCRRCFKICPVADAKNLDEIRKTLASLSESLSLLPAKDGVLSNGAED